jgi:hypothetical protein
MLDFPQGSGSSINRHVARCQPFGQLVAKLDPAQRVDTVNTNEQHLSKPPCRAPRIALL